MPVECIFFLPVKLDQNEVLLGRREAIELSALSCPNLVLNFSLNTKNVQLERFVLNTSIPSIEFMVRISRAVVFVDFAKNPKLPFADVVASLKQSGWDECTEDMYRQMIGDKPARIGDVP